MKFTTQIFETSIGAGCLLLAAGLGIGAVDIPSEAGYQGACVLLLCGIGLIWQAQRGGYAHRPEPEGAASGDWLPFVWVSSAILLNAATITTIGFILSCTLAFVLAVRGFHQSQGRLDLSLSAWIKDMLVGMAISAPVFWLFTKLLGINLPGLTSTGWI
jgi:putative tricarboxylic transport membrane protein